MSLTILPSTSDVAGLWRAYTRAASTTMCVNKPTDDPVVRRLHELWESAFTAGEHNNVVAFRRGIR